MLEKYKIMDYSAIYAEDLVHMWRESKRAVLGDYHEPHDFNGFLSFLNNVLVKKCSIKIVVDTEKKYGCRLYCF